MKTAIELIAAERKRQIEEEGFTPEHDDEHTCGELSDAASCYMLRGYWRRLDWIAAFWPWFPKWWKPTPDDRIRELIKACALGVAEIERLQRMEEKEMSKTKLYFQDETELSEFRKPSEPEPIGRTDSSSVRLFRKIWERHSIEFKDCDNMPVSRISTSDVAFYEMEKDFAAEIAKLLPSSRSQEDDVNMKLLEALKMIKELNGSDMTGNETWSLAQQAISNHEKQMKL